MYTVLQSGAFKEWVSGLKDARARARIAARVRRAELGNFGDSKSVGSGVSEMRIDHGPGYRLYFTVRGQSLILLLCGGDKRTQVTDIRRAQQMLSELKRDFT